MTQNKTLHLFVERRCYFPVFLVFLYVLTIFASWASIYFTSLLIPCIFIIEVLSKKFPTILHCQMKVLQSYSIFLHVSVVSTTIIRERSQTVLSWKEQCIIVGNFLDSTSKVIVFEKGGKLKEN